MTCFEALAPLKLPVGGGETWFTGVHPDLIWSQVSMSKMKKIGLKICPEIDFFSLQLGNQVTGSPLDMFFFIFD